MPPEYAQQPTINSDEIRETIAQSLLSVQNIIEYGNYNENKNENFNMNCFDINKRKLAKGQWVDVKDTVDQWLDAQVIEVSEDYSMVKIHYNNWSNRWDEWLPTNSPRIMPFRYHTRQSSLTNYHSPYPNKKPDAGITLLSFENLNKNICVHPQVFNNQRNSNVIRVSSTNDNNQNNNNENNQNNENNNNINNNENNIENNNNNENNNQNNNNDINDNYENNNNTYSRINESGRRVIFAHPLPPIQSPKHLEPDPENHLIKNIGGDGFLGIFKEFEEVEKTIKNLYSSLIKEHNCNTEELTPQKLIDLQNQSFYNLIRLIPLLDRTGRIYSDISTFIEHSIKTNQLELLSKNIFAESQRINENLKFFSTEERRRVSLEILSHNTSRENRSGTLNFVPPVNKFESKLNNPLPLIDTPYMTYSNDYQIHPIYDIYIQTTTEDNSVNGNRNNNNINNNNSNNNNASNNNNSNTSSNNNNINNVIEQNNSNNTNNNINEINNSNERNNLNNNNFIRNISVENFTFEINRGSDFGDKNEKKIKNDSNDGKRKKFLGIKTLRKKSKGKKPRKNNNINEKNTNNSEKDDEES